MINIYIPNYIQCSLIDFKIYIVLYGIPRILHIFYYLSAVMYTIMQCNLTISGRNLHPPHYVVILRNILHIKCMCPREWWQSGVPTTDRDNSNLYRRVRLSIRRRFPRFTHSPHVFVLIFVSVSNVLRRAGDIVAKRSSKHKGCGFLFKIYYRRYIRHTYTRSTTMYSDTIILL